MIPSAKSWVFGAALAVGLAALSPGSVLGCTTVVVAGSATANGRPLLWKNRDADDHQNQVVYRADGKYAYVGLVNKGDAAGIRIWAGINTEGFAIMNSASYNMEVDKDTQDEALFMKLALQTCATVADFQNLLEKTNGGGRDVSANFGVIDARGGASYFETGIHRYKRFNADDPLLAPRGFIVRTNYSDSADLEKGTGFIRRERANALMEDLVKSKGLSAQSLLRVVCRDTANARIGSYPLAARKKGAPNFAYTADSICRFDTASCVVFEGAGPSEPGALAKAWVILGLPASGVAVPLWAASGDVPSDMAASADPAPLTVVFDQVRDQYYPDSRGELKKYMDIDALSDPKQGFLAPLQALEDKVFKQVEVSAAPWRKQLPPPADMAALQGGIAREVLEGVSAILAARRRDIPSPTKAQMKTPPAVQPGGVSVSDIK